jgi:hypothetical protein
MKLMYKRHQLPNPGYEEGGILTAINEVTGSDFSALYGRMVNTTEDLPYELLGKLGLTVDVKGVVSIDGAASQRAIDLRKAWLHRPSGI